MVNSSNVRRYVLYALGEVVLVVIGILIALWVNRSNEERKRMARTHQVGEQVLKQLRLDIADIDGIMVNWEEERAIADTILRLTKKDEPISRDCKFCPILLTGASIPTITDRIPKSLTGKDLHESDLLDVLTEIEFHYLQGLKMYDFYGNSVINFTTETLQHWQDTYHWFADLTSRGNCEEDCMDYFYESPDYRNRVAYYELILLESYYNEIDVFKELNLEFIERLEKALQ